MKYLPQMKIQILFTLSHALKNFCYVILFSSRCHMSLLTQKWKCVRQVERFAPVLDTAGGSGICANRMGLWVCQSMKGFEFHCQKSKGKKKHRRQVLLVKSRHILHKGISTPTSLPETQNKSVYNVAFVQKTNKNVTFCEMSFLFHFTHAMSLSFLDVLEFLT